MKLTDTFWKEYELDLQEVKLAYLSWAITYAKEPDPRFRHLFLWDHQKDFCIINSRFGRSFAMSPFGFGVRGVPKPKIDGMPPGLNEIDLELRTRLTTNTHAIRETIRDFLDSGKIEETRTAILNFYWLKLASHELLFDRVQYGRDETGRIVKGRFNVEEPEGWETLTGIRNRIVNTMRFGDHLETVYVASLNKKLPGFSRNSSSTFISSAMVWNKYALCAFDCGPVLWSRKGFVCFNQVKKRMNKIGWPYRGTARELLKPLYTIAMDYRKPHLRQKGQPNEG
ncbi:MAG: hypothetical protein ABIN18_28670 [Pseudomonadota bacterium]